MKVRALITLVVGKGKQIAPNGVCDVSDAEAKRLISLGYAESLKKTAQPPVEVTEIEEDESDGNGDKQPIQPNGQTGNVQK
ncbi:MAG: hypothetical protein IJ677_00985 [Alphaproteobacteria bacterium]|nr:hypothetical protein [Alphaproteobacteria bacterium]